MRSNNQHWHATAGGQSWSRVFCYPCWTAFTAGHESQQEVSCTAKSCACSVCGAAKQPSLAPSRPRSAAKHRRGFQPGLVIGCLLLVASTGCTQAVAAAKGQPAPSSSPAGNSGASDCPAPAAQPPIELVIGVTAHNESIETRKAALTALQQQMLAHTRPGSAAVTLTVYPLEARGDAPTVYRLDIPCVPPVSPAPTGAGTFGAAAARNEYLANAQHSNQVLSDANQRITAFFADLGRVSWPEGPVSAWRFFALAARSFGGPDPVRRVVVVLARDEDKEVSDADFCTACVDFRGATVVWLGFDQPSPALQHQRELEWSQWQVASGASRKAVFARSGDPVPDLLSIAEQGYP